MCHHVPTEDQNMDLLRVLSWRYGWYKKAVRWSGTSENKDWHWGGVSPLEFADERKVFAEWHGNSFLQDG